MTNHPGLPGSNSDGSRQSVRICRPEDDPRRGGYRPGGDTREASRALGMENLIREEVGAVVSLFSH